MASVASLVKERTWIGKGAGKFKGGGEAGKSEHSNEYSKTSWTNTNSGFMVSQRGSLAEVHMEGKGLPRKQKECREVSNVCTYINNTKDFELVRDAVYIKRNKLLHSLNCIRRVSECIQK